MQNNRLIYNRIKNISEELSRSERKIAHHVLEKTDAVLSMTVNELAESSNTSPASVIRFCKSVGIPSFTDLKIKLSAETTHSSQSKVTDISSNTSIDEIKENLLLNAYQSMEETLQLINNETIPHATEYIKKAPVVYVFGIGSSFLVAENFVQKWSRVGKTVICFSDLHILIASLNSAPKDSLLIVISNSGETKEILSLVKIAKSHNLKVLSITQFGNNPVSRASDYSVQTVRSKEAKLRSGATSSLMAQFITTDLLYYSYILENYDKNISRIQQSRKDLENFQK